MSYSTTKTSSISSSSCSSSFSSSCSSSRSSSCSSYLSVVHNSQDWQKIRPKNYRTWKSLMLQYIDRLQNPKIGKTQHKTEFPRLKQNPQKKQDLKPKKDSDGQSVSILKTLPTICLFHPYSIIIHDRVCIYQGRNKLNGYFLTFLARKKKILFSYLY